MEKNERMRECALCGGKLARRIVPYAVYGIKLGDFPAEVCGQCGEKWFDENTARKIEMEEKKHKVFGLNKASKVSYSGNSLIIRIPKNIAVFMHIRKNEAIVLHPEGKNKLAVQLKQ